MMIIKKKTRQDSMSASVDDEYFRGYENIDVHELMIRDVPRTEAYRRALIAVCKDKVVMDVGAGTGVLSVLAAVNGAKHVYAVEPTSVAHMIPQLAAANGVAERVTVIQARVEQIARKSEKGSIGFTSSEIAMAVSTERAAVEATELLDGTRKVDILVSEWMGFYLLHESMLASVLLARDAFLASDGLMLPDRAQIRAALVDMSDYYRDTFDVWRQPMFGLDLSTVGDAVRQARLGGGEPLVRVLGGGQLLSAVVDVLDFDLAECSVADLDRIETPCNFATTRNATMHGVCFWFDVHFPRGGGTLSTSPQSEPTHWKQCTIMLPNGVELPRNAIVPVVVTLDVARQSNYRQYRISLLFPQPEDLEASRSSGAASSNDGEQPAVDD
jgi:type I protein arginine methyltransferase